MGANQSLDKLKREEEQTKTAHNTPTPTPTPTATPTLQTLKTTNSKSPNPAASSLAISDSSKRLLTFQEQTGETIVHGITLKVRAAQGKTKTVLKENNSTISFKPSTLKLEAIVTLPAIKIDETWEIGWVQACTSIKFCNRYGDVGFSSWEFPQLNAGKPAVNDSNGSHLPFYGNRNEVRTIVGPMKEAAKITVSMNDTPFSIVSLKIPTSRKDTGRDCDLTYVEKKQSFLIWLGARCQDTGQYFPLKTLSWEFEINIDVNPTASEGSRATLLEPKMNHQPHLFEHAVRIPNEALHPPFCNKTQMMVWRPWDREKKLSLLVFPGGSHSKPTRKELTNEKVYN